MIIDPDEIAQIIAAVEAARATSTFLTTEEVAVLTGRKFKALQIKALKQMHIAFVVNAVGRPVVLRSAIEGRAPAAPKAKPEWIPSVLKSG